MEHARDAIHGSLPPAQKEALHSALDGRLLVVCFGGGVDSTAMLVALHDAGIVGDLVTFADTGGEKPETIAHVEAMSRVLQAWGWPPVTVVRKTPLPGTGYADLFGNNVANQTLPSLAFGMKSCSIKWKQGPQDQLLKGVKSGPNACAPHPLWTEAKATGQRITKLIGYDCGPADRRRAGSLASGGDEFDYAYPLQLLGWERQRCLSKVRVSTAPPVRHGSSSGSPRTTRTSWRKHCTWNASPSRDGTVVLMWSSSTTPGKTW